MFDDYVVVDLDTGTVVGPNVVAVTGDNNFDSMSDDHISTYAWKYGSPMGILADITSTIMRSNPSIERTVPMDTIDTTSTDIVIIDAESDDASGFGSEVAKTLLVSTATSAGVFGGFVVIALLTPKVKSWLKRRKNDEVIEGEADTSPESPEKD